MEDILNRAFKLNKNILILGETGSGKSCEAKKIHFNSKKGHLPFVEVNITTLSENLFESELFGFVKSAFTGADREKDGFIERAGKGTLFLDEIGDLTLSQQVKLLTFIESKKFFKVGCTQERSFLGNLIFATNKNLEDMVIEGKFREDLYYRISNFKKILNPLRVNINAEILNEISDGIACEIGDYKVLASSFVDEAKKYSWPGNYRELKSCLEYLYIIEEGRRLDKSHFRHWLTCNGSLPEKEKITSFRDQINQSEKDLIYRALARNLGKINQTSRDLRLNKTTLIAKIKKYDINTNHFSNLA